MLKKSTNFIIDIESVPEKTGVYIFKNSEGKIIYVGKAKNIKGRVKQYFIGSRDTRPQVDFIKKETASIEYHLTTSEQDALILEYSLINKNKPKYNVKLKDSNKYPYIKISNDIFPVLSHVFSADEEGSFFGPYTSAFYVRTLIERMNKIFKLKSCKIKNPKKTCLEYQISNCGGVCEIRDEQFLYGDKIKKIKSILQGSTKSIIDGLKAEMQKSAENEEFERAVLLRDTISFIRREIKRGKKIGTGHKNRDVISFVRDKSSGAYSLLKVRDGVVCDIFTKRFSVKSIVTDEMVLSDIISEHYALTTDFNFSMLVAEYDIDKDLKEFFSSKSISVVKKGGGGLNDGIFETAKENAENLLYYSSEKKFTPKALINLKETLILEKIPEYIIGVDISHFSGGWTSGAVILFKNGKPHKSGYRYYNLEDIGNNDYLGIKTILQRYLEKYEVDLILIDGGLGQLNVSKKVLADLGLKIPLFALAKRYSTLFDINGREVMLGGSNAAVSLIKSVRDESHRFANKLRKILMKKSTENKKGKKNGKRKQTELVCKKSC